MTNSALARLKASGYSKENNVKTQAYNNLFHSGVMTNIEAENFIKERSHWFN